jgi:hypothetical protein
VEVGVVVRVLVIVSERVRVHECDGVKVGVIVPLGEWDGALVGLTVGVYVNVCVLVGDNVGLND